MMIRRALLLLLATALAALQPPFTSAQQTTTPPVSETLAWINQHFELVNTDTPATSGMPAAHGQISFSLDFNGCTATLTQTMLVNFPNGGAKPFASIMVTGPFNVGDIIPNKIIVASPIATRYELNLALVRPVSVRITTGTSPTSITSSGVGMYFATQDMANRQAKAWHDAAVACGGKAVPDNLY